MKINTTNLPAGISTNWTREYLINVLTSGKNPILTDPILINAFLMVDRAEFVPKNQKNLAYTDLEIEIGYGEKLNRPTIIAQMLSALKPRFGGKYMDVGTGSGYVAAILAYVAGESGHVYTIERVQWLWENARNNLQKYKNLKNIDSLYRDGLQGLPNQVPFDGIHIAFALDEIPDIVKKQLKIKKGILVMPTLDYNLKIIERVGIDEWIEETVPGFVMQTGQRGIA